MKKPDKLILKEDLELKSPALILGLSGWMNGGEVSLGTIRYLRDKFNGQEIAYLNHQGFYIYNIPGSMEVSALFRPHSKIEDGLIKSIHYPTNIYYGLPEKDLILFSGKEPHLAWEEYEDAFFYICQKYNVQQIFFIGSVAGMTPHTREPRVTYTASDECLKEQLGHLGIRPVTYKGPASIVTSFSLRAARLGISLVALVYEIPAYVEGYNPRCVETSVRLLSNLLNIQLDIADLKESSKHFAKKLDELVLDHPELAEKVKTLETDYDNEAFEQQVPDIKGWFGHPGLRVD